MVAARVRGECPNDDGARMRQRRDDEDHREIDVIARVRPTIESHGAGAPVDESGAASNALKAHSVGYRAMPKGYVIVNVHVTDPESYPEYATRAYATVRQFGGRYLTRGAKPDIREGEPTPDRFVVLEFPSVADATRWYDSDEYRPVRALRWKWAKSELFIVEGHDD